MRIQHPMIGQKQVSLVGSLYSSRLIQKKTRGFKDWIEERAALVRHPAYRTPVVVASTALLFFTISLSAFFISLEPPAPGVNAAVVPLAATTTPEETPPLEVTIARTGLILLRGAEVTHIDGTTFTLRTTWGATNLTWIAHTEQIRYETREFGTRFIDHEGERILPTNIQVGDYVTVTGTLDPSAAEPTLKADSVRLLQ